MRYLIVVSAILLTLCATAQCIQIVKTGGSVFYRIDYQASNVSKKDGNASFNIVKVTSTFQTFKDIFGNKYDLMIDRSEQVVKHIVI